MMTKKRLIEFFLFPDATGLDIMGPLDVFTTATNLLNRNNKGDSGYSAVFSSDKPGPVQLNSGLVLHADTAVSKGNFPDIFLVPGGLNIDKITQNIELLQDIQDKANQANQVISVCGGAFILAACGLLDGKRVTTHWDAAKDLAHEFPDIDVQADAIYIHDGKISTSAGVTAGIDLSLSIVEAHHGFSIAMEVARMLVLYLHRPGGQSQFSTPMKLRTKAGKQFSKLHDWLIKNLEKPLTVEMLADNAAMSPRNFSRVFTKTTGISPGKYIELMRLNQARELLEESDASIETVADASGFKREERLRRVFVRHLGVTPSQYRIHFNLTVS
ncbi:MAG: GlxA family transcriptional regulator [Desulfobacteraceae bacterium]|nr:GlxA family transcriptional regulator [Desulfobacteraceae bacterium]